MNGANNNDALFFCDTDDLLHNVRGRCGILNKNEVRSNVYEKSLIGSTQDTYQSTGRFIEKEKSRLLEQSNSNRQTPTLSATHTGISGVRGGHQTHLLNDLFDDGVNIFRRRHIVEFRSVTECFATRQVGPMLVVLLDDKAVLTEDLIR